METVAMDKILIGTTGVVVQLGIIKVLVVATEVLLPDNKTREDMEWEMPDHQAVLHQCVDFLLQTEADKTVDHQETGTGNTITVRL